MTKCGFFELSDKTPEVVVTKFATTTKPQILKRRELELIALIN